MNPETPEFWRALRQRTNRITDTELNAFLWIGVMLRRYDEENPDRLIQYRAEKAWRKLIEWQALRLDLTPPMHFQCRVSSFLHAGGLRIGRSGYVEVGPNKMGTDNPWSIVYRSTLQRVELVGATSLRYCTEEYSINRVPTLDDDITLAWDLYNRRLMQERKHA